MKVNRMKPEARREQILSVAMVIAERDGYHKLERNRLAKEAEVATGMIHHVFKDMASLRKAVVQRAVENQIKSIIAQALALGHEEALKASDKLKRESLETLLE